MTNIAFVNSQANPPCSLRFRPPNLAWITAVLLLVLPALVTNARGNDLAAQKNWEWSGDLTTRYETYDVSGDPSRSPYAYLGNHYFGEFDLNANYNVSRYENLRAYAFGVWNQSAYRNSTYNDLILERATLAWEKGDAAVPFRVEAGDFFGNFSLRTMQRSLKGMQVEFQPQSKNPQTNSSLLVFSGVTDPIYRGMALGDEIFSGASYLYSTRSTDISYNLVHNYRQTGSANGLPLTTQTVASVAGEHKWRTASASLGFEFEAAYFGGDYGTSNVSLVQDAEDYGIFARLYGRSLTAPVSYELSYERYGDDFQPRGGSASANRESIEWFARHQGENGLTTRMRVQRYVDSLETPNPLFTHTAGLDFVGPIVFGSNENTSIDGTVSFVATERQTKDQSTHSRIYSASANLSKQLNDNTILYWGANYNMTDDLAGSAVTQRYALNANLDWSTTVNGTFVRLGPGISFNRNWSRTVDSYDIVPSLSFDMFKDGHSFSADYSMFYQDGFRSLQTNTFKHNVQLSYNYSNGPHSFGLEGGYIGHEVNPGSFTRGLRAAVRYTYRFDASRPRSEAVIDTDYQVDPSQIRLTDLSPGTRLQTAIDRLVAAGISGGVRRDDLIIYNVVWLPDTFTRQRLVLFHDGSKIIKSAVLISLDASSRARDAEQQFNEIRDSFIRRYGTPYTYEEGEFDVDYVNAVNTNRLIRVAEWQVSRGTIRMGMPRRLDRKVQIEIHFAQNFPGMQETRWGLDEVR